MLVWLYMSSMVMSWPESSVVPQRKPGLSAISTSRSERMASQITSSQLPLKFPRRYRSEPALPITRLHSASKGSRSSSICVDISGSDWITSENIGIKVLAASTTRPLSTFRSTRPRNLPCDPDDSSRVFLILIA